LSSKDSLQRIALHIVGAFVKKKPKCHLAIASPYIPVKRDDTDRVELSRRKSP
jgi:hypothetical protein